MSRSATLAAHPTATDTALQAQFKARAMETLNATPFNAPAYLKNPHAQTIWSRYGDRAAPIAFRLERWDTPDDDFLRIQFLDGEPKWPTALLLHGLEGSAESTYLVRLAHALRALQFNVIILEFRSCGGEMNRARRMYHSGETTDLDFVVEQFGTRFPDRPLYLAGYSLGANVIGKWLGERAESCPEFVRAAAIVSAPYDLVASGPFVDSGIRRQIYVRHFLRKLIPKAIEKERQFPGCVDIERVKRSKTFEDFDTYATAALHGFRDAEDYYSQSSCGQFLERIRRPIMLLSAADDPFNPGFTLPRALADESPYLHPQFTEHGGHVGFVHRHRNTPQTFWAEFQIAQFFNTYRSLFEE